MFLNISNHPVQKWDAAQRQAAEGMASPVVDLPFPAVPPEADEDLVAALCEQVLAQVPDAATHAMVQGEFTLTFALVKELQARGVVCVAATTARDVVEGPDGTKMSRFRFVRFREYR